VRACGARAAPTPRRADATLRASGCGPLPAELQRLLSTLRELDERMTGARGRRARQSRGAAPELPRGARAELRSTASAKYEECMELPALALRQPTPEQSAQVATLRTEIEETHKVRCAARANTARVR
jgi:hypothetical protein